MNWLAHLFLSTSDAEYRVGNVIADWVKGDARAAFGPGIQRGLACHRVIDLYTDAHPIVRHTGSLIRAPFKRFAAVLVDVFYDHVLANDWSAYCSTPLAEFTRDVYASFATVWDGFDERVRWGLQRMAGDDWLGSYAKVDGIDAILRRMSRRLSRPNVLGEALPELVAHREAIGEDFHAFFPQLIKHVEDWRGSTQLG